MVFCILLPQSIISKMDEEWTPPAHVTAHRRPCPEPWPVAAFLSLLRKWTALRWELREAKGGTCASDAATIPAGKERLHERGPPLCTLLKALGVQGRLLVLFSGRNVGEDNVAMTVRQVRLSSQLRPRTAATFCDPEDAGPERHFLPVERPRSQLHHGPPRRRAEPPACLCLSGDVSSASLSLGQTGQMWAQLLLDLLGKFSFLLSSQVAICHSQCNFRENLLFRKPVSSLV